jgi:CRP-like cAMP-binding protein
LFQGAVLFDRDASSTNVYFPVTAVVSFLGNTGGGGSLEVWSVGSEGLAGISGILGRTKPFTGVVQVRGTAMVVKADACRRHFQRSGAFHDAVLAYYDSLLAQVSYLGLCNTSHPVEQRFCRWLLMIHDRARSDELKFTQDAVASILGTRRATISVAAAALQDAGLISYTPGLIRIRSRRGLEKSACLCYKIVRGLG